MTAKADQTDKSGSKGSDGKLFAGELTTPDGYSFKMYIGADGIGIAVSTGFETEEIAHRLRTLFVNARQEMGKPYPMCFNITNLEGLDPKARKIWSNTALAKDGPFSRVAVHGGGFFVMSLMNFYARIARIPVRCFRTETAALAWLRDEKR